MRSDFSKVVTERPRWGHHRPSVKTGRRLSKAEHEAEDHGSTRYPISRHRQFGYDAKEFSDLIGPLRRYIQKQVGKPWSTVQRELDQTLTKRTLTGRHIWTHVDDEVSQNTFMATDEHVYDYRYSRNVCLCCPRRYSFWRHFYVHPTTGLLCETPQRRLAIPPQPVLKIRLSDTEYLEQIEGIWYRVMLGREQEVPIFDSLTGLVVRLEKRVNYDKKRQLSKKDLKRYGLQNILKKTY